ncbi:MAG: CysZ protein [Shewanella sp.]|uniref:sulfate transporter CysZ n=1 Tax=Shewanella TaxID=22 RepID=UPI001678354D|nr:sulfate transporter CysZ [Shewanella fodinae]MCL2907025.1 sulfate transporter CysZ [Shewanella fodinae]MDN5369145.1 CysZ protein [Shewanella sp.]GGZ04546.1 sulfate transporter CysZ [Shewanella fodinae]
MPSSLTQKKSGISYFIDGFSLIKRPGLRRFVLIPLLVNLVLFGIAIYFAVQQLDVVFGWIQNHLPDYLSWLNVILWPLAIVTLLVLLSFIFSSVMNWISAPFNGLLAEKTEQLLTGKPLNTGGALDLVKDLPRIFGREWQKLKYYLPRAIIVLLLFFVPVAGQTLFPVIWFFFSAWMMAIQYCDYPFDNHKVAFHDMKFALQQTKGTSVSFGVAVTLFSMIPVLNFIVMPVAICGATAMWVERYRDAYRNPKVAPE